MGDCFIKKARIKREEQEALRKNTFICLVMKIYLFLNMPSFESIKKLLHEHKERLSLQYGLNFLAVFGSYARNQQTSESDVDILVEFNKPTGMEFIDLAEELEKILSTKVDLVSKRGLKEDQFKAIEKELRYV
jgi:predicted nucleotidyltransferase